jgi:ABC-type branched-subunit amino acid transport system substrate-binding protein
VDKSALLAVLAVALLPLAAAAQEPEQREEFGRQIYRRGVSPSGSAITAVFGNGGPEVPASAVPCAGCHGRDGRGRPEGGITPADIRWSMLRREIADGGSGVRQRPPYSERLLSRAFTMGFDAGGTALSSVMPRYRLSVRDARDLVTYLQSLGVRPDPGVLADSVRVGVLLPPASSAPAGFGDAIRLALAAYLDEIAQREKIFGRSIDPRFLVLPADAARHGDAIRSFLKGEDIFCLVSCFLAGLEETSIPVLRELEIPVVGATARSPATDAGDDIFYLDGGIASQAGSLAAFALETYAVRKPKTIAIYSPGGPEERVADAVVKQLRDGGWPDARALPADESAIANLREAKPGIVLLLARNVPLRDLATAWGAPRTQPVFLVPGIFLTPDALSSAQAGAQVFAAYPTLPADYAAQALDEYRNLARRNHLTPRYPQAQLTALCGAKILVEALRRAGHDLSREKLVATREALRDFETGLSQPISFGPNRRIGSGSAHIVTPDRASREWELVLGQP